MKKMKKDNKVVVVTPAMPTAIGFFQDKRKEA